MIKLKSKTTRGVAALALLAGSLFATNASAEYVQTGCEVYNWLASPYDSTCVSPGKIGVNTFGTFYLQTYVQTPSGYSSSSTGLVKVFTVTGNNILYQGPISGVIQTKTLRGYGAYSTYKVRIDYFKTTRYTYEKGSAIIYRN